MQKKKLEKEIKTIMIEISLVPIVCGVTCIYILNYLYTTFSGIFCLALMGIVVLVILFGLYLLSKYEYKKILRFNEKIKEQVEGDKL